MTAEISTLDTARVEAEIHTQERRTSAEIVAVVASQSDDYVHVPIHVATGLALVTPVILHFLGPKLRWVDWSWSAGFSSSPFWIYFIQLGVFIVAALVLLQEPFRIWVTPRSLKRKYARRLAAAQFLAANVHATRGRSGVLIFVSLLEHHVEIIADVGITKQVDDSEWQSIIDAMVPLLKADDVTGAFVLGVEKCGEKLARIMPEGKKNPDELPNRMIVLGSQESSNAE
jgi:putative membrane protein